MLATEGSERSFASNVILAVTLSCVAGMVNAAGFFAVGTYTSHVTGNVSLAGDELAQGNLDAAVAAFGFVAFFLIGVITASVFMQAARRKGKARYAQTLILEAVVLFTFTLVSAFVTAPPYMLQLYLTGLLSFAMGMQNALVTRISGAVIRTTHITGIVTDIGIELVAVYYWYRDAWRGKTFLEKLTILPKFPRNAEMKQLLLHLAILFSFITGAIAGPMLYVRNGPPTMLIPAGLIVGLVAFDLLLNVYARHLQERDEALREARLRGEAEAAESRAVGRVARLGERVASATASLAEAIGGQASGEGREEAGEKPSVDGEEPSDGARTNEPSTDGEGRSPEGPAEEEEEEEPPAARGERGPPEGGEASPNGLAASSEQPPPDDRS